LLLSAVGGGACGTPAPTITDLLALEVDVLFEGCHDTDPVRRRSAEQAVADRHGVDAAAQGGRFLDLLESSHDLRLVRRRDAEPASSRAGSASTNPWSDSACRGT
jgi:hypothetical protein